MKRPPCKELVLQMLKDNPITDFSAADMARAIKTKLGHRFGERTVRKVLNELFKEGVCESYYGKHGPDGFYLKRRQDATDAERAREQERHAAWQVRIQAEWQTKWGKAAPTNLTGPPGLWPDDVKES